VPLRERPYQRCASRTSVVILQLAGIVVLVVFGLVYLGVMLFIGSQQLRHLLAEHQSRSNGTLKHNFLLKHALKHAPRKHAPRKHAWGTTLASP
jgi:hypothetical protein